LAYIPSGQQLVYIFSLRFNLNSQLLQDTQPNI